MPPGPAPALALLLQLALVVVHHRLLQRADVVLEVPAGRGGGGLARAALVTGRAPQDGGVQTGGRGWQGARRVDLQRAPREVRGLQRVLVAAAGTQSVVTYNIM